VLALTGAKIMMMCGETIHQGNILKWRESLVWLIVLVGGVQI